MRESRGNRQAVAPRPHARGRDPGNGHISNATVPHSECETVEPIRFEIGISNAEIKKGAISDPTHSHFGCGWG